MIAYRAMFIIRPKSGIPVRIGGLELPRGYLCDRPMAIEFEGGEASRRWHEETAKLRFLAQVLFDLPVGAKEKLFGKSVLSIEDFDRWWTLEPLQGILDLNSVSRFPPEVFRCLSAKSTEDPKEREEWLDLFRR